MKLVNADQPHLVRLSDRGLGAEETAIVSMKHTHLPRL